jgi:hypothetical protein
MDEKGAAMIPEDRIKSWIVEALQEIKESDPAYTDVALNDQTVLVGATSPFDSVAFSFFAAALEERIEAEAGVEYVLQVDELYQLHGKSGPLLVGDVARLLAVHIPQGATDAAN